MVYVLCYGPKNKETSQNKFMGLIDKKENINNLYALLIQLD